MAGTHGPTVAPTSLLKKLPFWPDRLKPSQHVHNNMETLLRNCYCHLIPILYQFIYSSTSSLLLHNLFLVIHGCIYFSDRAWKEQGKTFVLLLFCGPKLLPRQGHLVQSRMIYWKSGAVKGLRDLSWLAPLLGGREYHDCLRH